MKTAENFMLKTACLPRIGLKQSAFIGAQTVTDKVFEGATAESLQGADGGAQFESIKSLRDGRRQRELIGSGERVPALPLIQHGRNAGQRLQFAWAGHFSAQQRG